MDPRSLSRTVRASTPRLADPGPPTVVAALLVASLVAASTWAPAPAAAQEGAPERPEADPADVETPDAIVAAAYDAISGGGDEARDWDRLRSLFLPEARLIPSGRGPEGRASYQVLTVEEFVEYAGGVFADSGFYEREIHAEQERYGDIAHVFSTYESLRAPDADPFARGINSFQLWHDGERWWIVTIFWHGEREGAPIPERYGG